MPRCFLPCLCLDPYVHVLLVMFMLRSTCLCAPCHTYVSRSTCQMLCLVLFMDFCLLLCLFLMFWPLGREQIQILWFRPTSVHLGLHQKGLDHFLYTCVCLLASMLYIRVCRPRSKFCHALCPSWAWACWSLGPLACMVASVPLVAYLDVTACEIHLSDVGLLNAYLPSLHAMICIPCLLCAPVWLYLFLCIFARFPTCSCMHPCVCLCHQA